MKLPLVAACALALVAPACSLAPDHELTASASSALSESSPIALLRAESVVDGDERLFFTMLVQSVAAQKSVFVHMSEGGGAWTDYPASLAATVTPGVEIWKVEVDPSTNVDAELVVALTADNMTSWDNNGGSNYKVGFNDGPVLGETNVLLNFAQMTPAASSVGGVPAVFGGIDLRNIAYAKSVTIVYSSDGWQTVQTAQASYNPGYSLNYGPEVPSPNPEGFESWQFDFSLAGQASSVQLAIAYTVAGVTYWDDNFGQNYTVVPSNGPTPGGANGAATGSLTLW